MAARRICLDRLGGTVARSSARMCRPPHDFFREAADVRPLGSRKVRRRWNSAFGCVLVNSVGEIFGEP